MRDEFKALLEKVDEVKRRMAKDRDDLRDLESELNDLIESIDLGIDSLEIVKQEMQVAIDSLSQFV